MKLQSLAILLGAVLVLSACRKPKTPPTPFPGGARSRLIVQKKFKLGTMDFGGDALADAIPAALLTELAATERFSVYEGGGISGNKSELVSGAAITEKTAKAFTDGYLNGTITSRSDSEVCFDVRLANSFNHEVIFAKSTCAALTIGEHTMKVDREAMTRMADEISRTIKEVGNATIASVDGSIIFIDKKKDSGLIPGMVGYIVATGSSGDDAKIHDSVKSYTGVDPGTMVAASTAVVIGELVVIQVEEKFTIAELYRGDYALPGDTVYFK